MGAIEVFDGVWERPYTSVVKDGTFFGLSHFDMGNVGWMLLSE